MRSHNVLQRVRFAPVAVAVVLMVLGLASSPAHALLYAYARQQVSGFTFSGGALGATPAPSSSSSAVNTALGTNGTNLGFPEALQTYLGPAGTAPGENTFTPKGQVNVTYARGDVGISGFLNNQTLTMDGVAETYAGSSTTGSAAWSMLSTSTLSSTGTIGISFNYLNNLSLFWNGVTENVQAEYALNISIQDAFGTNVFSVSPSALNRSASLFAAGTVNMPGSGSIFVSSPTLAAGTYTITISGSENVFASIPVPEPTTLAFAALAMGMLGRRRR